MIRYQRDIDRDQVKVMFSVPADGSGGHKVAVVGDFNDWDPNAAVLRKKGANFSATVRLDPGKRYAFRYVAEDGRWFNDDGVEGYEGDWSGASMNCVIDLTGEVTPALAGGVALRTDTLLKGSDSDSERDDGRTTAELAKLASQRTESRLEASNVSVDQELAQAGACGFVHLASGRVCQLARGHSESCQVRPRAVSV